MSFLIQKGFKLTQMAPGSRLRSEAQVIEMSCLIGGSRQSVVMPLNPTSTLFED
jgi:hypothetical protein